MKNDGGCIVKIRKVEVRNWKVRSQKLESQKLEVEAEIINSTLEKAKK